MTNKAPKINVVFDRKKRASTKVKSPVEIRITYDYKQKYVSTGIMLYSNQWKNGKIVNCSDILQVSQILSKLLTDIRQVILSMMQEGSVDIMSISNRLQELKSTDLSFLEYCKKRAEVRKYGKTKDSQERYERFLKSFTKWGKISSFQDVNEGNIILYDKYLIKKKLKPYSKWNNYHRFLNSFIIDAIEENLLQRNPYKWVNIPKYKDSKGIERCLTPEEFNKIKEVRLPTESLDKVRDIFIFQTYTCLSYSDLREFDSNLIQEVKGMSVYVGNRVKTSRTFTIPLLSSALEILHQYNGKLPIISNVKYNEYLKLVANAAGIEKPLSSHWARHTGATILLNEGVDMKIVSKICGHSSTKITEQVYAKLLDETVVDAVAPLEDKM